MRIIGFGRTCITSLPPLARSTSSSRLMPLPNFYCCRLRRRTMTNPVDPETGAPLHRDVRPLTLTYKGESITVDMPGWYSERPDGGVHTGDDMKVSDRALNRLKARTEGLFEPEEIRRIRKRLRLSQEAAGGGVGGGGPARPTKK